MADRIFTILRQQYDANDSTQLNGWEPNTISSALGSSALSVIGYTAAGSDKAYIPADFKDHKTVFVFNNTHTADSVVKFHKGDTYQGVNDLSVSLPLGISVIWLDSAKFVDKRTGKIRVTTAVTAAENKDITLVGYEMR